MLFFYIYIYIRYYTYINLYVYIRISNMYTQYCTHNSFPYSQFVSLSWACLLTIHGFLVHLIIKNEQMLHTLSMFMIRTSILSMLIVSLSSSSTYIAALIVASGLVATTQKLCQRAQSLTMKEAGMASFRSTQDRY